MKIAVQGCCHGELDAIYNRIQQLEQQNGYTVDLLLICGDFQAMRTQADLNCFAVPPKYLQMGDFPKYYSGEKVAPILTLVIGGNHEASNYMWELYHGGFLAPNIFYLGAAGVVQFNGIRIAGASGIYKYHDYNMGHYESLPYDRSTMRSIYHIRSYDVHRLMRIRSPDIFLSHDWPQSVEQHGNVGDLLRRKPFFKDDVKSGRLGSPPLMELLKKIRPARWFAAHLHVRFEATVVHDPSGVPPPAPVNPDEIEISFDDDEDEPPAAPPPTSNESEGAKVTQFLSLDKCVPGRNFIEIIDVTAPQNHSPPKFTFDPEWLAITRAYHDQLPLTRRNYTPTPDIDLTPHLEWVKENIGDDKDIASVQMFYKTSPVAVKGFQGKDFPQPAWYTNPQTVSFCEMLGIENKINPPPPGTSKPVQVQPEEAEPAPGASEAGVSET